MMQTVAARMRESTLIPATLLGVGLALAGCGKSDRDRAADTVTAYLEAFATGDAEEACGKLTEQTKRVLVPQVGRRLGARGCDKAIPALRARLTVPQADALKEAKVTSVRIRGRVADVRFRAKQLRGVAKLRKADGDWKISLLPEAR